jgi:hypothetical protein
VDTATAALVLADLRQRFVLEGEGAPMTWLLNMAMVDMVETWKMEVLQSVAMRFQQ